MSQSVGILQTLRPPRYIRAQATLAINRSTIREKACKEFSFQLPVELLRAIFEEYIRLDLPVQNLLDTDRQWRTVAVETQSLWRQLLLSVDAIPGSLRAGSVHACGSEGQATRILNRSGIITKLKVTFVLGPKEAETTTPETHARRFKNKSRIITNLEINLTLGHNEGDKHTAETGRDAERQPINIPSYLSREGKEPDFWGRWNQKRPPNFHESIASVVGCGACPTISDFYVKFIAYLTRLRSLLVPGVPAVRVVDKLLIISADSIHAFFSCLKSLYLKNNSEDRLLRVSIQYLSLSPIQTANRDSPSSITHNSSSYTHTVGPLVILSQCVAILGLSIAHIDASCDTVIMPPKLDWFLFSRIALGDFGFPCSTGLQGMAIDCVQETHFPSIPPLAPFRLLALQTVLVNPNITRFNSLKLDDRGLAIPTPNPEGAANVIKSMTAERGKRVGPRHLMLVGPLHDAHLTHALELLSENMASLKLVKNGPLCLSTPAANPLEAWAEPVQPTSDPAPNPDVNEVEDFQPAMVNIPQFLHNDHGEPISSIVGIGVVGASVATSAINSTLITATEVPNLSGQILILKRKAIFVGTYSKVYVGMFGAHKVAVKMLRLVKSRRATKRKFRRELFISWHLRHPNILPLYGYSECDDGEDISYALVLKWADKGNAAQYIYSHNLSWNQCTKLVHNVADGLRYLHAFNPPIIHADLKPLNILIDKDGVAQIGDFGISRLMEDDVDTGMTTTTPHFGTVRYLAPELVDPGKAVPSRPTDIWALGCVAHEFIYRVRPYADIHISWRISQAIDDGVPPAERPMHPGEDIPVLWNLLECCWSPNPERRPTAEDFFQFFDQNRDTVTNALRTIYGDLGESTDGLDSTPSATLGNAQSL